MWFVFALISALVYSFRSILEKWSLKKVNPYILAFSVRFFALPLFTLPYLFGIAKLPILTEVSSSFWWSVILVSLIMTPVEMIFFYKALKTEEVSYVAPLLGLSPLITAFFGALFFKEYPSPMGIIGMIIIIIALYLLNTQKQQKNILEPLKHLFNNKAFRYIIIMMSSYSLGILIDKLAITSADIFFYSLINYSFVSIVLFLIALIKAPKELGEVRANILPFGIIGAVVASYTWLRFLALERGNAGYVSAVLSSSVLFSTIIGAVLFKEKNLTKKFFIGILILIGLAMIKLSN
ncbi:MAG: hypothetical protein COU63_04700 [Candidatus Pacebacteria bacterium CG10_big_fil_rev_8_21_14_0_10_36_11]|nr:EamA family transporter [Candidatus Pacearchaeota archaeon]OIP73992.1 MAG: hypothetical protein AUK08_01915 [Candidatus Pacebacteria bacterium CG2_30_36_39]PIR64369.1 MAG: hypothetical protein COU63_04700 [Candidatus Pacebacteria bacterium CG10_big_fil_rev_8_21_14_0_10_36_11]